MFIAEATIALRDCRKNREGPGFLLTACNAAAMALNGDEVSKISREIEDIAVAARAIYHRLLDSHLKITPTALTSLEGVCRQSIRNKQQWAKAGRSKKHAGGAPGLQA